MSKKVTYRTNSTEYLLLIAANVANNLRFHRS